MLQFRCRPHGDRQSGPEQGVIATHFVRPLLHFVAQAHWKTSVDGKSDVHDARVNDGVVRGGSKLSQSHTYMPFVHGCVCVVTRTTTSGNGSTDRGEAWKTRAPPPYPKAVLALGK